MDQKLSQERTKTLGNIDLSSALIYQLVNIHGVFTFCVCPGGRNAPLVSLVSKAKGLKIFSFFEERSAGFFAMGRARREKAPVAVITTSGTAVAELLPAVIESYYSDVPLVLITADRPSSYRGTGAPQSIEQVGIFSHYVEKTWDLENPEKLDLSSWAKTKPCHINICFDEPLIDKKIKPLKFSLSQKKKQTKKEQKSSVYYNVQTKKTPKNKFNIILSPFPSNPGLCSLKIKSFFSKIKKPLCIVAELPESVREGTEKALSDLFFPIYAEALSGLRESQKLNPFILKSGERFLKWLVLNKKIDSVIRIGRRPIARWWRDLEKTYSSIPILSVSDQPYLGLSRLHAVVPFSAFFKWSKVFLKSSETSEEGGFKEIAKPLDIFKEDAKQSSFLNTLLKKHPLSEPALIRDFSQKIPAKSLLFLGNSLPIREWDLAGGYQPDKKLTYLGNRGANGIDGLLSSFLGASEPDRQNWCLIGDLSCLYDLSAPWVLKQIDQTMDIFLVVINNTGGQIFSSLFSDPLFLNTHSLQFKEWAKMWNLNYYSIDHWPRVLSFSSPAVIELTVHPDRTKKFNLEYSRGFWSI